MNSVVEKMSLLDKNQSGNLGGLMITEESAREMMKQLSLLKKKIGRSDEDKQRYHEYESHCIDELKYFVENKARKYQRFLNHSDLTQDGFEALLKAVRTFKLTDAEGRSKGSFFFWAGLFVNTKLSRSANNHTVIRYPMHIAKVTKPFKTDALPVMIDTGPSPEKACEQAERDLAIQQALKCLSRRQKEIVNLAYGFDNDRAMSINKICEKKKISRTKCLRVLNSALDILRTKIEI